MKRWLCYALALWLCVGCDSSSSEVADDPLLKSNFGVTETEGDEQCDGLDPSHCIYPFPSDYFLQNGTQGRSVVFGPDSLPKDKAGKSLDPQYYKRYDGFSLVNPIHFRIGGATLDGVVNDRNKADSIKKTSKTIVLEAESGRLIPHWVEWDHFTEDAKGDPLMIIRLAEPLKYNKRYIVAVRGLTMGDGKTATASKGFSALRDKSVSTVIGIHKRREHFETNIFKVLAANGIERSTLQLAWDFTTLTEDSATGRLRDMRKQLMQAIGTDGPTYEITEVVTYKDDDPFFDHWAKTLKGVMQVPSFMLPRDVSEPFRRLRTDAQGNAKHEGFEAVEFEVHIPHSAMKSGTPVAVMQFGHGFLLTKEQATEDYVREVSDRKTFIIIAINFQGLNTSSSLVWLSTLVKSVERFPIILQEPMQGFMNHFALSRMIKGRLTSEPELMNNSKLLYDPQKLVYYGNSQGGTTGCLMMALQQDIKRGILGVPGGAFSMLLHQSSEFQPFVDVIKGAHPKINDLAALFAVIQLGFNEIEPLHYSHRIVSDTFDGLPPHEVQLRVAKEDAQVDTEISFMMARSIGARLMIPAVRPIFGLETATFPTTGSTVVEYDFGVVDNPRPHAPAPKETDTHGVLRRQKHGQDQYWHFLMTGETIEVCDGACDPD